MHLRTLPSKWPWAVSGDCRAAGLRRLTQYVMMLTTDEDRGMKNKMFSHITQPWSDSGVTTEHQGMSIFSSSKHSLHHFGVCLLSILSVRLSAQRSLVHLQRGTASSDSQASPSQLSRPQDLYTQPAPKPDRAMDKHVNFPRTTVITQEKGN